MDNTTVLVCYIASIARNTPLGRGQFRRKLLGIVDYLGVTTVRTQFRGVPILLHMDNTTERKALLTAYDRREMDFLASHLTGEDAVFIDIGANSGLYAHWLAAKMAPSARAIAIEPCPALCERMRRNLSILREAGIETRVDIVECAAGDQEGTLKLDGGLGTGSLVLDGNGGIPVRVQPLNEILKRLSCSKVSALKIDVEGYEDRALIPFFQTAPRQLWPKAICMEFVHSDLWKRDAIAELMRQGYRTAGKTHSNLFLELN
jgi:FkbM family methyltransferase